jgi:hypothetical protein
MKWNLHGVRGTRDQVKSAVSADKVIPASLKAAIAAEVDSLPADVSACRFDAYCQDTESKQNMTLTRNIQITLVGIKI